MNALRICAAGLFFGLSPVAHAQDSGWGAEALTGDVRGARVRWRRGGFLRLNDLAYAHGGRIVLG